MTNQKDKLHNEFLAWQKVHEDLETRTEKAKEILEDLERGEGELYWKLKNIKEDREKAEEIYDEISCKTSCAEEDMGCAEERFDAYNKEGHVPKELYEYPYAHNPIKNYESFIKQLKPMPTKLSDDSIIGIPCYYYEEEDSHV